MASKIYRCTCDFFVKANSEEQVREFLARENDFIESHVLIEEISENISEDEIWADYTNEVGIRELLKEEIL